MERAERMFRAYNEQGDKPWRTFDGRIVPPWSELSEDVKAKWRAAAKEPDFLEDDVEVDPLFRFHKLTTDGIRAARTMSNAFNDLLVQVRYFVPEGRYLALVQTKLEEACMFAKKGIAVKPGNHE